MLVPKRIHYVLYFSSLSWPIRSQVFNKLFPSVPLLYASLHPAVKRKSNPFIHGIFSIFWCNLIKIIILCWSLSSAIYTNTQNREAMVETVKTAPCLSELTVSAIKPLQVKKQTHLFNKHKQAESDILFQYVLSAVSHQLSLCFTQAHTQLQLIATEKIPEC